MCCHVEGRTPLVSIPLLLFWIAIRNFLRVSQYRSEFMVVPRNMKSISNIPFLSQKTVAITSSADFSCLNFWLVANVCIAIVMIALFFPVCNNGHMFDILWLLSQEILPLLFQTGEKFLSTLDALYFVFRDEHFWYPTDWQFSVLQIIRQNWVYWVSAAHSMKFSVQFTKGQPEIFQHKCLDFLYCFICVRRSTACRPRLGGQ